MRDVPVRSVRFPCNGHGGRSPDRSPPIRALGGGDVLHAARQTVAAVARGGCVGWVGGERARWRRLRRRVTTETTVAERVAGVAAGRGTGECAPWKGVRDRQPKVIMIAEMPKTKYEKIL